MSHTFKIEIAKHTNLTAWVMMKFMFNVAAITWMMSDSRIWA